MRKEFLGKRKLVLMTILLCFLMVSIFIKVSGTDSGIEGFGAEESKSFGETSRSFDNVTQVSSQNNYFVDDTLIKLIFLSIFTILSLYVYYRKRRWRKYLLISSVLLLGFYLQGFLCPLTAVQNIFIKYNTSYLLLFLIPVLLVIFRGRIFCGYICPFGAIQELLNIRKYRIQLSKKNAKLLVRLKYILLFYLIIRILITGDVILVGYTPFKSLFSMGGTPITIIITVLTIFVSLFNSRPFCKYFCPLGALLALVGKLKRYLSTVKIFADEEQDELTT
ncbi:MAG: 4Fe-4S binding protein [Halanaerobiales bacterium]|nr:4Fe-4S binding protein [Halanaerobiales bacterium]